MDPELFRHLVPGLIFWLPTLVFMMLGFELPRDEGLTWATVIFTSTPPVGWLIYQNFRALWLSWPFYGYERAPFVEMLRKRLRLRWAPREGEVIADFSELSEDLGIRRFRWDEFRMLFHWRSSASFFSSLLPAHRAQSELALTRRSTLSLEPVADLFLFDDASMEYARTISTVRYAYMTAAFAFANGCLLAFCLWLVVGPMRHGRSPFMEAMRGAVEVVEQGRMIQRQEVGLTILFAWILGGLVLAIWRFRLATAEYFARTALISVRRSRMKTFDRQALEARQDVMCKQVLDQIGTSASGDPLALFDLDGTLIHGDIGEAVFALMLRNGLLGSTPRLTFRAYEDLKVRDEALAYREIVRAMSGCSVSDVRSATSQVLEYPESHIELDPFPWTV